MLSIPTWRTCRRGYGLAVTVPAELATPLGLAGPLLSLQFAPTSAVVRGQSTPVVQPVVQPAPRTLPSTGADGALLGVVGLALLAGAAVLRRPTGSPPTAV